MSRHPDGALTLKQQAFIRERLANPTLSNTQVAILAGYAPTGAKVRAHEVVTNRNVATALAKAQQQLAAKAEVTQLEIVTGLRTNRDRAMQATPVLDSKGEPTGEYRYEGAVANRSIELLGKTIGMFTDRPILAAPAGYELTITLRPATPSATTPVLEGEARELPALGSGESEEEA